MEKEPKKARRLDAELRLKARARRRLSQLTSASYQPLHPINVGRVVGMMAHTRTLCSCPMCGNRRRHGKGADRETLAERKARLREKE